MTILNKSPYPAFYYLFDSFNWLLNEGGPTWLGAWAMTPKFNDICGYTTEENETQEMGFISSKLDKRPKLSKHPLATAFQVKLEGARRFFVLEGFGACFSAQSGG